MSVPIVQPELPENGGVPPPTGTDGSTPFTNDSKKKSPAGRLKVPFYKIFKKQNLRVDSLAQNTILSAQKAPAGRPSHPNYEFICPKGPAGQLSNPNYELICPKGPCGSTFWPKFRIDLPKSPLRVDLLAQITI